MHQLDSVLNQIPSLGHLSKVLLKRQSRFTWFSKTKIPFSYAFGTTLLEIPISCNEQIIPSERSPRNLARLILMPPGSVHQLATITCCPLRH